MGDEVDKIYLDVGTHRFVLNLIARHGCWSLVVRHSVSSRDGHHTHRSPHWPRNQGRRVVKHNKRKMIIYTHTMLLLLPPVDGADGQKECMEMSAENGKRWESFLFFEPFGERWPNQKDRRGGNSIRTHYTYHGARKPRRDFLATHTHTVHFPGNVDGRQTTLSRSLYL